MNQVEADNVLKRFYDCSICKDDSDLLYVGEVLTVGVMEASSLEEAVFPIADTLDADFSIGRLNDSKELFAYSNQPDWLELMIIVEADTAHEAISKANEAWEQLQQEIQATLFANGKLYQ